MLRLRGHKYQQTCHSPGQTNLNGYEKKIWLISWISFSPSPLSHILSVANEKYSSGRKKSPPSRHRGVGISTVLKKKNNNIQLASKRPISQGWDWPFKKAENEEPATKMVEKNNCHCWRWKPLLGGLGTCSPREILKIYAPNEAIWGYSTSFHKLVFFTS